MATTTLQPLDKVGDQLAIACDLSATTCDSDQIVYDPSETICDQIKTACDLSAIACDQLDQSETDIDRSETPTDQSTTSDKSEPSFDKSETSFDSSTAIDPSETCFDPSTTLPEAPAINDKAPKTTEDQSPTTDDQSTTISETPLITDQSPTKNNKSLTTGDQSPTTYDRQSSCDSVSSDDGARDSGIEAESDFAPPDEQLAIRIANQVESYFADASVARDKFLLKHIRRNKEGYVSLKLVSSFKKVKQLTRDWRAVAFAIANRSDKIRVNEAGTKIRRVDPLPDFADSGISRAVLAVGLDKPTIASVSAIFADCGEIASVRICRAGNAVPADLAHLVAKCPEFATANSAWVEFENCEAARMAMEGSREGVAKVFPLAEEKKPTQPRKNSVANVKPASRKNSIAKSSRRDEFATETTGAAPVARTFPPRRKCLSLPQTQSPNLRDLAIDSRRGRPKSKSCTEFALTGMPANATWVQRHLIAAAAASAASAAGISRLRPARTSQGSLPVPEGVLRFPKGPDGSRGFGANARNREAVANA